MATNNVDEQDLLAPFFGGDDEDENDLSAMTLVEHLEELRSRIFKSALALVIASIIAFVFRNQIVAFLELRSRFLNLM